MMPPDPSRFALRHQRRRRRRLVVTAAFVLAVLVAVAVVVLLPKNKTSASPTTKASTQATQGTDGNGSSTTNTTVRSTTTTNPDAGLPALGTPTASSPLRVLEVGDSLGEDLGFRLQEDLPATGVATVTMDSQGDTGLSNENYYDWPAHLQQDLATVHPQIVVIFLGANDGQGFDVNGVAEEYGSPEWISAYTQRVDEMLQESNSAGARVVWVGMPLMQDPTLNSEMLQIDGIFQEQSAKYPGTLYMSSTPVLCPDGQFTFSITTSAGQSEVIRTPDGVHLTTPGAELVAQAVMSGIDTRWHLTLKDPAS
jgi:hypothetical protein